MGASLDSAVKIQADRQQKNQRAPKAVKPKRLELIPEQADKARFQSAGMAYKKIPAIDTLRVRDKITALEHTALSYYRDQATAADRSAIKSNIDFSVRSGNQRPIGYASPQEIETARLERDMGQLYPIARAIAVDDYSATEWAIEKHGGRERLKGKAVVMVPKRDKDVDLAIQDLRMAAHRIVI